MVSYSDEDLSALQDLIDHSQLLSVDLHELSARRAEVEPSGDTKGLANVEVQYRTSPNRFGVRLVAQGQHPAGEYRCSVAGEFELLDGFEAEPRPLQLFTNEVAIMLLIPYLREAISSVTARVLGEAVQLPLVSRGEITVEVEPGGSSNLAR